MNVAVSKQSLGNSYDRRARRSVAANDLDRELVNLELALPQYREAARIFGSINLVDTANEASQSVTRIEKNIRQVRIQIAARTAAATATAAAATTTTRS